MLRGNFERETGSSVFPCEDGAGGSCEGDCDGDGQVSIGDLTRVVTITLGIRPLSVRGVYGLGMRKLPLADWLRLNAPARFGLVAERAIA